MKIHKWGNENYYDMEVKIGIESYYVTGSTKNAVVNKMVNELEKQQKLLAATKEKIIDKYFNAFRPKNEKDQDEDK